MANTRLPALLKYAAKPSVTVLYESGERIAFPVRQNVAQVVAAIQDSGGKSYLPAGKSVPPGRVKILEVGLPSDILSSVEILDLPVGHRGLPGYGMDAAIWTTVATQAWRESERAQWAKLPQAVRSRSLLAVTFCDLVAGRENNLKRLQARLETSAKPHFRGICFVANGDLDPAAAASRNKVLFVQIQYLAQQFAAERVGKAMAIARRLMANAIAKLGPGTEPERNGLGSHAVAEASRGLFDGDWVAALKRPLPDGGFEKPSILRNRPASGAAVKTAAHQTTHASHSWGAGGSSKDRRRWMRIGAAALVGGTVTLGAIQLGLIGMERSPISNPLPSASEAVEEGAKEKAEKRMNAEAEAAAAEARGKAQAEAAAAEARGKVEAAAAEAKRRKKAEAEAVAAEARRKAEAEAVAAEARRKAEAEAAVAEARRKAEAEAVAAEARRKAEAEAVVAEARRKAEAEAVVDEARRKAEAEAVVAEARRKAEAEAAVAEESRKAEAAAAEAKRRKKAEAEAAEAERRRRAEAEEAERRRRAAAEEAPRRSSGSSPIMHGIGQ